MNKEKPLRFDELNMGDIIYEGTRGGVSVSLIRSSVMESDDGAYLLVDYTFIDFNNMPLRKGFEPEFTNDDIAKVYEWYITRIEDKYYKSILPAIEDAVQIVENNLSNGQEAIEELKAELGGKNEQIQP